MIYDPNHEMPKQVKPTRVEDSQFWRVLTSHIRKWFAGEFRAEISPDNWTRYSEYSFEEQAELWASIIEEDAIAVIGAAKSGIYQHMPLPPTTKILQAVGLPIIDKVQVRKPEYQVYYCSESDGEST